MHEVLVNRLGGLSLPRKSVVRLTDRPDMTLDVYRGRKTTKQQQQQPFSIEVSHKDFPLQEQILLLRVPYFFGYMMGFSLSRITTNNKISHM